MIKKKILLMVAEGVVVLAGVVYSIGVFINLNKTNENLIKTLEESQAKVIAMEDSIELLKEEKLNIKNENEILRIELSDLHEQYEELNSKYKKEISPVKFDDWNLHVPSNGTIRKLEKGLKGTGLEGLGEWYLKAEQTYGVNAIFLMALTAQESGWGNSNRAKTQNNLSGYAVYSSSSKGTTFSSKEESIMATAKLIAEEYINSEGAYYNGTSVADVNIKYCPDDGGYWSRSIIKIAYNLVDKINSQ